jgi:1-acyl-sn-glycerol-3-phosphate acyltransferase
VFLRQRLSFSAFPTQSLSTTSLLAVVTGVSMIPAGKPLTQSLALAITRLIGWRIDLPLAVPAKCVIVGAHHTSGSDFFIAILGLFASNLQFRWVAKDSAFRWPFGWLMRRLGGIPVNRSSRGNFVAQVVDAYHSTDFLRIVIAPEGTRSEAGYWKTGFYYIALGAGVPIMLGYADYQRKVMGIGAQLEASGDIEADMGVLARFYDGVIPRYPHRRGEVRLRQVDDQDSG